MSPTPLLDRIKDRRDQRIGPVCPVPAERMSPFAIRLAEKRLHVHDLSRWNGAVVPAGEDGAA